MCVKWGIAAAVLVGAMSAGVVVPTIASANPNGPNQGDGTIVSNFGQCVRPQDIFVPRGGFLRPSEHLYRPSMTGTHDGVTSAQTPGGQGLSGFEESCWKLAKDLSAITP